LTEEGIKHSPSLQSILLKAFLLHFKKEKALPNYLSESLAKRLNSLNLANDSLNLNDFIQPKKWLESIHISWLVPYFKKLPPALVSAYLELFSAPDQKSLLAILNCQKRKKKASFFVLQNLSKQLKSALKGEDIVPVALLSPSPLLPILNVPYPSIQQLIFFLSLHDLACELKQIVDKVLLEKIQTALKPHEHQYLIYQSKQPIRWVPPKIDLKNWDGQRETLVQLLMPRGLARLARGTCLEEPSFLWHLTHKLELEQGKVLTEFYKKPLESALIPIFQKQLQELTERIKT
jgi:hypothetical protein